MGQTSRAIVTQLDRLPLHLFLFIFFLGFGIRVALLCSWMVSEAHLAPFGEIGKVAVSLAQSGQFADPYKIPTGPTAHPTPVYAGLLGLIYWVFGVTATAGYIRALVSITGHSLLFAALPWLGQRLGVGRRAGILAGIAGAVIPQQGSLEIVGGSDATFATLALAGLLAGFLTHWTAARHSSAGSLLFGICCGVAFHCSPPLLPVAAAAVLFGLWRDHDREKWLRVACIVLGAVLACIPWAWRNYATFDELLFVRGNFGLELRLANHDGAAADIDVTVSREPDFRHPGANLKEAEKVRDLGESEYMRQSRQEALEWIGQNPGEFVRLTALRVAHFWCGPLRFPWVAAAITAVTLLAFLGLWHSLPAMTITQRATVVIPLLTFPLVYYFVSYVPHYRAPLEWLLLLLACAEVQRWLGKGKDRWNGARS